MNVPLLLNCYNFCRFSFNIKLHSLNVFGTLGATTPIDLRISSKMHLDGRPQ